METPLDQRPFFFGANHGDGIARQGRSCRKRLLA